jgi:hypothetical protein
MRDEDKSQEILIRELKQSRWREKAVPSLPYNVS